MKKAIDDNLLSPLPVVLVGALVNGRPNYLVIGYIAPFNFGKHVFFSLYKKRYTRAGIADNGTFSVNIPSQSMLRQIRICGTRSGRDIDKAVLFENFYGELKTAPMIKECPVNIECEVTEILDYDPNEGIVGRVVASYVDTQYLVDGKMDFRRVCPVLWATGGDFNYYSLGERLENRDEQVESRTESGSLTD